MGGVREGVLLSDWEDRGMMKFEGRLYRWSCCAVGEDELA
jgi:hypothetical protein